MTDADNTQNLPAGPTPPGFLDRLKEWMPVLAVCVAVGGWLENTKQQERNSNDLKIMIEKLDARLTAHESSDGHAGTRMRLERVEGDILDIKRQLGGIHEDLAAIRHKQLIICTRVASAEECLTGVKSGKP